MDSVRDIRQERDDRVTPEIQTGELAGLVSDMGTRLQAQYLDGAIPYLREAEPELWARLLALDEDDSLGALLAYERLFQHGLARFQASRRQIAA